jgi:hypothetical protein
VGFEQAVQANGLLGVFISEPAKMFLLALVMI